MRPKASLIPKRKHKTTAPALALFFTGGRVLAMGIVGVIVFGTPQLGNAFGSSNPISPVLLGQIPPKNNAVISSPASTLSGALRREKDIQTPFKRLETTLKNPNRIDTTVKDPATGAMFWRVENPKTGVTVDIDGKGNVLRVDAPKAPRSETPALNKSNPSRAVPQTQTGISFLKDSVIKKPRSIPLLPEIPQTLRTNLETGLHKIPPVTYEGTVYRNINSKFAADFDNISPSKNFRFRYNAEGEFGAGYYTELPEQSFSEIKAHGNDPFKDRTIVQAEVRAKLLDLTNPKNLNILRINEQQITGPSYAIPIEIARQAREMGFEGIRAPQADGSGKANIVLFTDKFSKGSYVRKVKDFKFERP